MREVDRAVQAGACTLVLRFEALRSGIKALREGEGHVIWGEDMACAIREREIYARTAWIALFLREGLFGTSAFEPLLLRWRSGWSSA